MLTSTDHHIHGEGRVQGQVMLPFKNLWPKTQALQDKRGQRATDGQVTSDTEPAATTSAQGMHGLPGKDIFTPFSLKHRQQICRS